MSCEYQQSELSCVLHPWQTPQYRWCVHWLPGESVTQIEKKPIENAGCLTCEYVDVWLASHGLANMAWASRHYKTGSAFFGELHQLGYWWHYCVRSLSLMILHTRFLTFCCASTSTYTRNKVIINMALTIMIFCMWWYI